MRRVLPHNLSAEESVIGACLFSGRAFPVVAPLLAAGDFYHPSLAAVYEAMQELDAAGQPIDTITVADRMRKAGTLGKLHGGETHLIELSTQIATVDNIQHHAMQVRDKAHARRLIEACAGVVERGYRDDLTLGELAEHAQAAVFAAGRGENKPRRWLADAAADAAHRLEQLGRRGGGLSGVPSGFWALDETTAGWQPGDLIVLAARPSMGKTAFALDCAINAAGVGCPSLIFSLEMSDDQLGLRALARISGVGLGVLRKGLRGDVLGAVLREQPRLSHLPVEIADWSAPSLARIRAEARAWRIWWRDRARAEGRPEPPGLIVCDYLQLIGGTGAPRRKGQEYNREREVAEISRGLKSLAKELGVPVMALSQLNRGVELRPKKDRRPRNSDLRESGAVEQDADVIAFVYRDEVYIKDTKDKGIAEIIIGKQRQGEAGVVRLRFDGAHARFFDEFAAPPPEQQEMSI